MITIDGSFGEGGGQILRTSLALALMTGQPVRMEKIRAGRKKPGLLRQHLTAASAAAEIGQAQLTGDQIGSGELTFKPGEIEPGEYRFAVGTAGSATLVLQTVLPALLTASGPSHLTLEGGTHNPWAPPFDFLQKTFIPIINRMEPQVTAILEQPGFYPAGGGLFSVNITPCEKLSVVDMVDRGEIIRRSARAMVSNLPREIAQRELKVVQTKLGGDPELLHVEEITSARGPGNIVMIEVESEHVTEVFTGFGERGVRAEAVAGKAVDAVRQYLAAEVPVGEYLADQLLLPFALAGGGSFETLSLSRHFHTNAEVLRKFLEIKVSTEQVSKTVHRVEVKKTRGKVLANALMLLTFTNPSKPADDLGYLLHQHPAGAGPSHWPGEGHRCSILAGC